MLIVSNTCSRVYVRKSYAGPAPQFFTDEADSDPHMEFCMALEELLLEDSGDLLEDGEVASLQGDDAAEELVHRPLQGDDDAEEFFPLLAQSSQVVMNTLNSPRASNKPIDTSAVQRIYDWNCAQVDSPYMILDNLLSSEPDPRAALLQFMIAATPDQELLEDMLNRYQDYLDAMTSTMEASFVGDKSVWLETMDNVPDTVNPVKFKLAYVQVPQGAGTALKLVWRVRYTCKQRFSLHSSFVVRGRDARQLV